MTYRRYLLLALAVALGWWLFQPAPEARWRGRPAPEEPRQSAGGLPSPWSQGDYSFQPLARFDATTVVLSRRNYRGGHTGALCRTDFALGWGAMSDADVLNAMTISQDMRWFFFNWRGELPVPREEVMHAAANMHLIPATDSVRQALADVRRHDLLQLSGYLVEVAHPDGWKWRSSLSRMDSGNGACEVVWVENVTHAPIPVP